MGTADDMTIELATAAHRDGVLALLIAQLREHHIETPASAVAAAIDAVLPRPDRARILVAVADRRVVGVAYLSMVWALEHGGLAAWLEELYVVPALRGRGVGKRLLRTACAQAARDGCAAVDLEVEADHARAANLYAREGFTPHQRARWVLHLARGAGGSHPR